jgi:hypothetical protein
MESYGISALPLMIDLLEETTDKVSKRITITTIARFGPAASEATPQLLEILRANAPKSKEGRVRELWMSTMFALGSLRAAQAVPELIAMLQADSLSPEAKQYVVITLGEIGPSAKAAIDELKMLSSIDPMSFEEVRLRSAAVVSSCRIQLQQAPKLIPSILKRIRRELDSSLENEAGQPNEPEGFGYDESLEDFGESAIDPQLKEERIVSAYIFGLMWLGSKDNPEIMNHQETLCQIGDRQWIRSRLNSSSTLTHLLKPIWSVLRTNQYYAGGLDGKWNQDGKILALINALTIGLEADNPTVQIMAADILVAMGPLAKSATPVLRHHLEDDNAQIRMRAAAALIHTGDKSDQVKRTLIQSATEVGEDVPPHIKQLVDGNATSLRQ